MNSPVQLFSPTFYICKERVPARSQSFRHRKLPHRDGRKFSQDDMTPSSRRESTPNISRRTSTIQRSREPRTDVWPEAKTTSDVEERFLRLPDSDEYTRVRQFNIDAKGTVVSRGDSFRRKHRISSVRSDSNFDRQSGSFASSRQSLAHESPVCPHLSVVPDRVISDNRGPSTTIAHLIYVLGWSETGKSALISQFMTSDSRNPFAVDVEDGFENTVSINISGQETELAFLESDSDEDQSWIERQVTAYLIVYSVVSKTSFQHAIKVVKQLRDDLRTKHKPVIVVGNKIDLERRRVVSKSDVHDATSTLSFVHFEVSVALNHDVDDLLVGILAEINCFLTNSTFIESHNRKSSRSPSGSASKNLIKKVSSTSHKSSGVNPVDESFGAAIWRFTQRKKKGANKATRIGTIDGTNSKCAAFFPSAILGQFRRWRRRD